MFFLESFFNMKNKHEKCKWKKFFQKNFSKFHHSVFFFSL